jgi:hypothetical protein
MRAFIAQLLNNDTVPNIGLRALGLPADAVYSAENVDTPDTTKPFIIIRWTDRQSNFVARRAPSRENLVDFWVYDKRGDYTRIDRMLARISALMDAVVAQPTETGWITQIDWVGDGGDNYDDVWKAIARTATYRVIASYTAGA